LRKDHPHLKMVVTQDAISPNGPYIRFLKELGFGWVGKRRGEMGIIPVG
jgi:hypothetical protein